MIHSLVTSGIKRTMEAIHTGMRDHTPTWPGDPEGRVKSQRRGQDLQLSSKASGILQKRVEAPMSTLTPMKIAEKELRGRKDDGPFS